MSQTWGVFYMRRNRPAPFDPVEFVRDHGIVLESAKGQVPTLAEAIAREVIRGNWWQHPKSRQIFIATRRVRESADILVSRHLGGRITYVHRRLWPALYKLRRDIGVRRLACVLEEHSSTGAHKVRTVPFLQCIPNEIKIKGDSLTREEALSMLGLDRMHLILGTG